MASCFGLVTLLVLLAGRSTPAAASTATSVSTGVGYTCALTSGDGVKCWGYGHAGELGNGSPSSSLTPVDVIGLTSGVVAVSAGAYHTCALTAVGGVKCWGANGYGQLGIGTSTGPETCPSLQFLDPSLSCSTTPMDVIGLTTGVTSVSAGYDSTCAVTTGGGVKCWGANFVGQLGDATYTATGCDCAPTPVDVTGLNSGVAAVSVGVYDACAVTTGGGVKCWGENGGQLGDGASTGPETCRYTLPCSTTPVDVTGLASGVQAVSSGGGYSCAVTTAGGVKCWGSNWTGQLGDGTTGDPGCYCRTTPVDVTGLTSGAAAVSTGYEHACALTTGGGVKCWGLNDDTQSLGKTRIRGRICA